MKSPLPAALLAALLSIPFLSGVFAQGVCNPNTQVCRTNTTLKGITPFRGAVGSARISHFPTPRGKGARKGVMLWVYGFGEPKAPDKCLDSGKTEETVAIGDADFPVALGFDLYVVDFCDPTDYLQRNAFVVDRLYAEQIAPTLTSAEKFGVMGNSMGGLVTLYALTRMESAGIPRGADLWITNDSPLKGAYIPLGIQLLGEAVSAGSVFTGSDLGKMKDVIGLSDSPAARQMLLAHHQGSLGSGSPHQEHLQFFRELETLGSFPKAAGLRTVAIASGSPGNKPTHTLSGITWRYPLTRSASFPIELNILNLIKWKSSIEVGFKGAAVLRVLPMTQTRQSVIRPSLEGLWYFNNFKTYSGDISNLSVPDIVGELARQLHIDATVARDVIAFVLPDVAERIKQYSRALIGTLNATSIAESAYAYEALPGGLGDQYPRIAAAMKVLPGTVQGGANATFIPTYSAISSNRAPNSTLVGTSATESPFNRFVVQGYDRTHVYSETDVACEETRRLAGAPYITSMTPAARAAGQGSFTLHVTGGNFTAQSVVSFNGAKVPTAFTSSSRLSAEIGVNLIAQPTTDEMFPGDPVPLIIPAIVSVNQYDAQGRLLASQHYADAEKANCRIGVTIQESSIEFTPARPTTEDTVSAVFQGVSDDSCIPQSPQVTRAGSEITITAPRLPGLCFFALTPYQIQANIGPLPPGEYRVTFRTATTQLGQRSFAVTHPRPVLTLLRPGDVTAGSPAFSLTVEGAHFVSGVTEIYWNGQRRATTFVDSGELTTQISAADIATAGNAQVTVRTATAVVSAALTLPILKAPPVIASLDPSTVVEDSGSVSLRVTGTNFAPGSKIVWLESPAEQLATTVVNPTQLTATIAAVRITVPGSYPIAVLSDGQTSAAEYFLVSPAEVTPQPPPPTITRTSNGASFVAGASRGSIASVFGNDFATTTTLASTVPLPRVLDGVQVMVAGVAAPLFAVTPGQINFQVPFEVPLGPAVPIWVIRGGAAGPESSMLIAENALGVFFYDRADGVRDPVITHVDRSVVTPANPARLGEVVVVWATGVGTFDNPPTTGEAAPFNPPASSTTQVEAAISGSATITSANVLFTGLSPGGVGLLQINVRMPSFRLPEPDLSLRLRFAGQQQFLSVPIPVGQN